MTVNRKRKLRRCVYCGARTYDGLWIKQMRRFVPACSAHSLLLDRDPHYREEVACA